MMGRISSGLGWWLGLSLAMHLLWVLQPSAAPEPGASATDSGKQLFLAFAAPAAVTPEALPQAPAQEIPVPEAPAATPIQSPPASSMTTAQKLTPEPAAAPAPTRPEPAATETAQAPQVNRDQRKATRAMPSPTVAANKATPVEPVITRSPSYAQPPRRPAYPPLARRRGWEGEVWLEIAVSANGESDEPVLLRSSGYQLLDQSALAVARQWRFVPEQRNGRPVPTRVQVPVHFALR